MRYFIFAIMCSVFATTSYGSLYLSLNHTASVSRLYLETKTQIIHIQKPEQVIRKGNGYYLGSVRISNPKVYEAYKGVLERLNAQTSQVESRETATQTQRDKRSGEYYFITRDDLKKEHKLLRIARKLPATFPILPPE